MSPEQIRQSAHCSTPCRKGLSPFPPFAVAIADVAYIHDRLRKYVSRAQAYSEAAGTQLQYVLLDMSPVTHLDSTGRCCTT